MAAGKGAPWSPSAENGWRLSEPEPVVPEKTSRPSSEAAVDGGGQGEALSTPPGKLRLGKPAARKACWEQGQSAFPEVPGFKSRLQGRQAKGREREDLTGQPGPQPPTQDVPREAGGGSALSGWPGRAGREQRSAFSKPAGCPPGGRGSASVFQAGRPADALGELWGLVRMADIPCRGHLPDSKLLVGGLWHLSVLPPRAPLCGALLGAPTLRLKRATAPTPTPSSPATVSWTLLPPTFLSLGVCPQNWCAKCNAPFRLTSDLVLHMRSHHKKDRARPDLRPGELGDAGLACPVCHERFREPHHLSRHVAAHS